MGKFIKIEGKEIEAVLRDVSRQYFAGDLKREQQLRHIVNTDLEIGITSYKEYSYEEPHTHTVAMEFQYVLSGWTKYLDLNTGEETEFRAGDFYAIEKDTVYAQKSKAGTKILFIKAPSINDKKLVSYDDSVKGWLSEKLITERKDHYYDGAAPKANSIKPAAAAAIIDGGKILMLKRADNKKWTLPGGTLEFGESLSDCALREVREECGYQVKITDIIGTYTDPNIKVEYSDGEVRQEFTIVYKGEIEGGAMKINDEATDYCWVEISEAENLPMAESQKKRIRDIKIYSETGERFLK